MKKLRNLLILLALLPLISCSNTDYDYYYKDRDITNSGALVTYTLSCDSSYKVVNKGGDIFVMFDYRYKEYFDGELIKDEIRTGNCNITDNQAWIDIFSPAVVNEVRGILNKKKNN